MPARTRASVVCLRGDLVLCVRLRDPVTGVERLFPPGGAVEPGETPATAAARETLEETGYEVVVERASELLARYPFTWAGQSFDCTTHFFRAQLRDESAPPRRVQDAEYNRGASWVERSALEVELGFDAAILGAVSALLAGAVSSRR